MTDPTSVTAADQEVLITRIFDAPRDQVFKAWTDPDEVAAWYGPEHMDVPRETVRITDRVCVVRVRHQMRIGQRSAHRRNELDIRPRLNLELDLAITLCFRRARTFDEVGNRFLLGRRANPARNDPRKELVITRNVRHELKQLLRRIG